VAKDSRKYVEDVRIRIGKNRIVEKTHTVENTKSSAIVLYASVS
jgi:hypothetical protein